MLSQALQTRWRLSPHEILVLRPIQASRFYTITRVVLTLIGSFLLLGLPFYFDPTLSDRLYVAFCQNRFIHKEIKPIFSLNAQMNLFRFKQTLQQLGWLIHPSSLTSRLPEKRKKDLKRIFPKILNQFFQAQLQEATVNPPLAKITAVIQTGSFEYKAGFATSIGKKTHMEDLLFMQKLALVAASKPLDMECFILMDGHGIEHLTSVRLQPQPINLYFQKEFLPHLKTYLNLYLESGLSLEGIYEAFKATFKDLHTSYPSNVTGSTFIGVFLIQGLLITVSIGDSSAVCFTPQTPVKLNLLADPRHPYFAAKLKKRQIAVDAKGRIGGGSYVLNMASALGDRHLLTSHGKPAVWPSLSFTAIPLALFPPQSKLVIGSDGVFDWVSLDQIHRHLQNEPNLNAAAGSLIQLALDQGSCDNLACIVLAL